MSDRHGSGATASLPLDLGYWEFTSNMQATWPDATAEPARRSGVACAIIVLRYMLSMAVPEERQRFLDSRPRGMNILLEHALLQSDSRALDNLCAELEGKPELRNLGFKSLMENPVMQQTLWDTREFNLFLQVLYRSDHSKRWGPPPAGTDLPPGDNGLVLWDGRIDDSLSDVVAEYFGAYPDRETGEEVLRVPNMPWFIRMSYKSRNPNLRFFYDLAYFQVRVGNHPSQGNIERKGHYRCVAAVKLRDTPDGSDTLRLYRPSGIPFFPEGCAFPMSDEWALPEKGEYMLYFVESGLPYHPGEPQWFDKRVNPIEASFEFASKLASKALAESDDEEGDPGAPDSGTQPAPAGPSSTVSRLPLALDEDDNNRGFGSRKWNPRVTNNSDGPPGQSSGFSLDPDQRPHTKGALFSAGPNHGPFTGGSAFDPAPASDHGPLTEGSVFDPTPGPDHNPRLQDALVGANTNRDDGAGEQESLFRNNTGRTAREQNSFGGSTDRDHSPRGQNSLLVDNAGHGGRGQNSLLEGNADLELPSRRRPDRGNHGTRRPLVLSDANLTEIGPRGELGSRLRPPASQSRPADGPVSGANTERIGPRRLGSRLSLPNRPPELEADNEETFF